MRLDPIDKPSGLVMRIGYWMARRQFGSVPTSFRVVYARSPKLAPVAYRLAQAIEKATLLDPELRLLVLTQSSMINGCTFCADLHEAQAVQAKLGLEKFRALLDFGTHADFSDRERAALAYTECVTRRKPVDDATFEELREHYGEREIVELTWLNAVGNHWNLIAVPLGIESDDLVSAALRHAS